MALFRSTKLMSLLLPALLGSMILVSPNTAEAQTHTRGQRSYVRPILILVKTAYDFANNKQTVSDETEMRAFPSLAFPESKILVGKTSVFVDLENSRRFTRTVGFFINLRGTVVGTMTANCQVSWTIDVDKLNLKKGWDPARRVLTVKLPPLEIDSVSTTNYGKFRATYHGLGAYEFLDSSDAHAIHSSLLNKIEPTARSIADDSEYRMNAEKIARNQLQAVLEKMLKTHVPDIVVVVN